VHRTIALTIGACGLLVLSLAPQSSYVVWNASPSVPPGAYWIGRHTPLRGEIAAVWLTPDIARLAQRRGYLPARAVLLKPVAAHAGDRVCRFGHHITFRARVVATALWSDRFARPMPGWSGCLQLAAGEVLVLSAVTGSFDSRYFGPVQSDRVIGTATLLWMTGHK
jgi:type IV secretory pathway protease TraF